VVMERLSRDIHFFRGSQISKTDGSSSSEVADEWNDEQGDEPYTSSPNSTPPPRSDEIDRWQCHTSLQHFGSQLQAAANAIFPNTTTSRYKHVYVLMLKWNDEDPQLPVSYEVSKLHDVFQNVFNFETESWDIPEQDCHGVVNQKILDFKNLGGNSKDDLKIIYYAGHGKLTRNRTLSWTRYISLSGVICKWYLC
jgi:hypothetical protein